jgi:dihydroorotate dehydrogenase (fumarate)
MDLTTTYLGMHLRTPLVPSASPLTGDLDNLRRLEDAGASAVVLPSLFEEQIALDQQALAHHLEAGTDSFAESRTYFPDPPSFRMGADEYVDFIRAAKEKLAIPVIPSLNGATTGGWTEYAKKFEQAGADAIELNIYNIPTDADMPGTEVEKSYLEILVSVKESVGIPVAVKLSPFFSNIAHFCKRMAENGANGLVLFNRFYQPDLSLEELEVYPDLMLSTEMDLRLPLTWIGILSSKLPVDFAATRGIHTGYDALKLLMVGANVTMMTSALLKQGPDHIRRIENDIADWMEEHEYASVEQLRGSMSQENCPDPTAFERAQYLKVLQSYHPPYAGAAAP